MVVTRGAEGPWGVTRAGEARITAPSVDVVDTVGAGDSFMAGLLSALVDRGLDGAQNRETLRGMPAETLSAIMEHAARAAA
ncbi:PfkB family carbohydrate kinase, partial [Paraburkholderia sp. SIMBA_027]|uniref:PfkB family carbohydrate kinase n=1 Tax=Paraburkholderia sp. SIMBA_027 TaxID=3085770 RepID=UPI003978B91E